ncbi:MAG TPA: hypothetical protein VIU11_22220 [Nakamurella sp.]
MAEPAWSLINVEPALDRWIEIDDPDELRNVVLNWLLTRLEDPYQGDWESVGRGEPWFGRIPRTLRGDRQAVCAYRIEEGPREIVCDSIAMLSLPI